MSENWVKVSERIVDQLKQLENTEGKDRLDLVRSLRFVLNMLQRSLVGWMQWVNNPDIMSMFSQRDLERMTKELSRFSQSFVEYDMEITELGVNKGLKASKKVAETKKVNGKKRFYV